MRVWTLTFVPPLTWSLHLGLAYALHATACETQSKVGLFVATIVCLAILATVAWMTWVDANVHQPLIAHGGAGGNEDVEPRPRTRERFVTMAAFAASLFFALLVIGQTVPMILLRACD